MLRWRSFDVAFLPEVAHVLVELRQKWLVELVKHIHATAAESDGVTLALHRLTALRKRAGREVTPW